jgi:ribosomal protein L30/L7E
MSGTINVKLVKSAHGRPPKQRGTLSALGLTKSARNGRLRKTKPFWA